MRKRDKMKIKLGKKTTLGELEDGKSFVIASDFENEDIKEELCTKVKKNSNGYISIVGDKEHPFLNPELKVYPVPTDGLEFEKPLHECEDPELELSCYEDPEHNNRWYYGRKSEYMFHVHMCPICREKAPETKPEKPEKSYHKLIPRGLYEFLNKGRFKECDFNAFCMEACDYQRALNDLMLDGYLSGSFCIDDRGDSIYLSTNKIKDLKHISHD